jgi:hypothetical protein
MSTTTTDFLPNATGLNLGSPDQRWDGFFDDITVVGSINTGPRTADSVQQLSTSQVVGFAGAIHTFILATGGAIGISLTLPNPNFYSGQVMKIKKTDLTAGAITIVGSIDGSSSYALINQYQYVAVEAGGGLWSVVASN